MLSRRRFLALSAAGVAAPALAQTADLHLPGGPSLRPLSNAFPGKRGMIVQRTTPPLLETPMGVFNGPLLTPNDRHYVRWHWPFPTEIDVAAWRLKVGGAVTQAAEPVARRSAEAAASRGRRRQPMRRQCPRAVRAAGARRAMGQWRDGQCALDGGEAERRARPRRGEGRGGGGALFGRRCATGGGRAGFRQVARHRPCPRWRGDDRLGDERRAVAAAQRPAAAADRARLVCDLLGEDARYDRGARQAGRRLLDDEILSDSGQSDGECGAGDGGVRQGAHRPDGAAQFHHQRRRRRHPALGAADCRSAGWPLAAIAG